MEGFRARRDGQEFPVASLEELFKLAAQGKLRRTDEVLTARGWVRAADLPEFRARFGNDPFDAWSDVDAVDAEAVYRGYVNQSPAPTAPAPTFGAPSASRTGGFAVRFPEPTPTPAPEAVPSAASIPLGAVPTPAVPTPAVPAPAIAAHPSHSSPAPSSPAPSSPAPSSPAPALRAPAPFVPPPALRAHPGTVGPPELGGAHHRDAPDDDEPTPKPTPRRASMPPGVLPLERGPGRHPSRPSLPPADPERAAEVIRFPKRPKPFADLSPARDRNPRPTPLVRSSWVFLWVAVGLVALGLYWGWVNIAASSRAGFSPDLPADPRVGAPEDGVPADEPPALGEEAPPVKSLAQIERELRSGLLGEVRPIDEQGELADALLIDLQNLKVGVVSVDAPVTGWSGRQNDVPRSAEVRVALASDEDFVRPLAAVGLVVGRYKRALRLDIPLLEVNVPGPNGTRLAYSLDARAAEEFYIGRQDLERFLGETRK